MFHPFTSYVVVPLFALANAGVVISGGFLAHAYGSAITIGIIVAYAVGKPIGVTGAAGLVTKLSHGRIRPPVGWVSVLGGGAVAGIGFTVSLLIASLAFTGDHLAEAKLGILTTLVVGPIVSWAIICGHLPAAQEDQAAAAHRASARRSSTSRCRSTPSATTSAARGGAT